MLRLTVSLCLILILHCMTGYAYGQKKVLVVHSYHEGFDWVEQANEGIIKALPGILNDIAEFIPFPAFIRPCAVHPLTKESQGAHRYQPQLLLVYSKGAFKMVAVQTLWRQAVPRYVDSSPASAQCSYFILVLIANVLQLVFAYCNIYIYI